MLSSAKANQPRRLLEEAAPCRQHRRMTKPCPIAVIAEQLRELPPGSLWLGFSGGLDSSALLTALAGLPEARRRGLAAIHVHHGLQPQADDWALAAARRCVELNVALHVHRVRVDPGSGQGLEAAARAARYQAFARRVPADAWLVLAHHRDDQTETFLLRLLRGAGLDGLAAMRAQHLRSDGLRLWRPWLELPRSAIEHYAATQRLSWVDDPSNRALEHDRSFLRHAVLPLLRQRWPAVDHSLAERGGHCAAEAVLLATAAERWLARAATLDPQVLRRDVLRRAPATLVGTVLRGWLRRLALPPPGRQLCQRVSDELVAATVADGRIDVGLWQFTGYRDLLHISSRPAPQLPADFAIAWDGQTPLKLPDGRQLRLLHPAALPPGWSVRGRRGGESLQIDRNGRRTPLKNRLQALAIPPWERLRLPLLFDAEGQLQAAGDLILSAPLAQRWAGAGQRLIWEPSAPG